ncbi:sigma factor-like helix-turn-helix DNA-binding protein [Variovorax sp. PvP013]|uniref:sigma factor-like helix-turn-helix DNA-binding protein n=1 Tax=Variovorax sp. PvP013 TaxID=3156435 RepID=UPI003D1F7926
MKQLDAALQPEVAGSGQPAPTSAGAIVRHARVVPSFMRPFVKSALPSVHGDVEAHELFNWQRQGLPSARFAAEMREMIVARRRASFDVIWNSPIGVRLTDEWHLATSGTERARLLALTRSAGFTQAFPSMTLRQVKDALKMPVAELLGLLARIEATYWVGQPVGARMVALAPQVSPNVCVDDTFRAAVEDCLNAAWVKGLDIDDLRFPGVAGSALAPWLTQQIAKPSLSGFAHELCVRLIAAHKATWAEELEDLLRHALVDAGLRPDHAGLQRRRELFLGRFAGLEGATLQAVADVHDLTRERVRQICEGLLASLRARPLALPALDRLFASASRVMPLSATAANEQLQRFLGEGAGIIAAIDFAKELGVAPPIQVVATRTSTSDGIRSIAMLDLAVEPSTWMRVALSEARRDCTFVGCTNFIRIAGILAIKEGVAQNEDTLRSLFERAPGFRILDAESGWFTLIDSDISAAAARMRKLMSVAVGSVEIDAVISALVTDDAWFYRDGAGRGLAMPPLHVMTALIGGWNWLTANAHNKYTPKATVARDALSPTEATIVSIIEEHGGAATRTEIAARLVVLGGVSNMAVSVALSSSPAIQKLEHSIYAIRGRPIPAQGLIDARRRREVEVGRNAPLEGAVDLTCPYRFSVTQSASMEPLRRQVVYLPKFLLGKIYGTFAHKGESLPPINIKANSQQFFSLALSANKAGVAPGDRFDLVIDMPNQNYEIIPAKATPPPL